MKTDTRARHVLGDALRERGQRTKVAALCQVTTAAVARWISGDARPLAEHRTILRSYLAQRPDKPVDLPEDLWLTATEQSAVDAARQGGA